MGAVGIMQPLGGIRGEPVPEQQPLRIGLAIHLAGDPAEATLPEATAATTLPEATTATTWAMICSKIGTVESDPIAVHIEIVSSVDYHQTRYLV